MTLGLDEEANTVIRDEANEEAQAAEALAADRRADAGALPCRPGPVARGQAHRPDAVLVPWQGWALTAHDFLVTRLMEIVVHSDDLAASVDVPTPEFPDGAVRAVLGLLTGRRRPAARPDRRGAGAQPSAAGPASVSAF